ncbi:MAG TPA: MFS transporter [Ramlibacter sp.]|jgi:MFS family permease|uniref:MFS transporter n=1 Tax=Ramlibacter sp. TaxID=1917967 RepID=UPI002D6D0066|nr:MFS transporter [Ramlibacter sp.]HZY17795.1 MFS transporter [Ramlibacter sp.]
MQSTTNPRAALLRAPNFRWLMAGSAVSLLGDQFTLIALPWLVLRMTGDTAALGLVLAFIGVPRALFILVGGAVVDRFSPYRVLMWTKHVNAGLLAALTLGVYLQILPLPALYALALALGLSSAFSIPSGTSILPHALRPQDLAAANGAMMGLRQLSFFIGPMAAGLLIALFGDGSGAVRQPTGIALAFAVDAASFALSAWTLSRVRLHATPAPLASAASLWSSIADGLRHVRRDHVLAATYVYWTAVALLVLGPLQIALPVLAQSQPQLGASALGLMAGAHGGGTLVGMALSGARQLRVGTLGTSMLLADVLIGLLFLPMGQVTSTAQGVGLMLAVGVLAGFMQVAVFTWIQGRVAPSMLGRAMSLFMFIFMGLVPLASAATGWVLKHVPLTLLFSTCGLLLVALAVIAWIASPMRQIDDRRPLGQAA